MKWSSIKNFQTYYFKNIVAISSLLCFCVLGNAQSLSGDKWMQEVENIVYSKLNITPFEGQVFRIGNEHRSTSSGLLHVYLQTYLHDLPVFESWADLHFDELGEVVFYNDELKRFSAEDVDVFKSLSIDNQFVNSLEVVLLAEGFSADETSVASRIIHQEPRLGWWVDDGLQLAVEVIFEQEGELWQIIYHAEKRAVLKRRKLTVSCDFGEAKCSDNSSHKVANNFKFNQKESSSLTGVFLGQYNYFTPGTPSPVYGNRTLVSAGDLIDPVAAPHGWHDADGDGTTTEYPYTQGNHVYAFYAPAGTIANPPPLAITREPISGAYLAGNVPFPAGNTLNFNYTSDLSSSNPQSYLEDAITNLFVWNNLCHDILYQHGFNEAAGNFQAINFTGGGGGDPVLARAQDGSGINNATFSTPADGSSPTMRMFLWDTELNGDFRDADFDNVIIAHEYAHGLSFRLVGGAGNVSCLGNFEQGGEGWSDFVALLLTIDEDDDGIVEETALGEGIRSIGNYVIKQGSGGRGIRSRFYSTNMDCPSSTCNDLTYDQLDQLQAPHGVGTLWCTMLWDMAWALINKYGFEPNWRLTNSTAGNIRALKIVIEGLKMTACNPSFPDMRDAVMAANTALYGSADEELLWEVFARRGLGVDAQAGGIASFDGLTLKIEKTVDKAEAEIGETVTYTLTVTNNTTQSLSQVQITDDFSPNLTVTNGQISNGGLRVGNSITWPAVSLAAGSTITRSFSGTITAMEGTTATFNDPIEGPSTAFVPVGQWIMDSGQTNPGSGSTLAWFHPSLPLLTESSLLLNVNLTGAANQLVFWQWFDLESGIDGGVIEIMDGSSWNDLGGKIREFPYTGFMYDALPTPIGIPIPFSTLSGRSGYTDYSGGWRRTVVDLSSYSGAQTLRFRYAADESTDTGECNGPASACEGWYLDDFFLLDIKSLLNEACVTSAQGYGSCDDVGEVGTIYYTPGALPVVWLMVTATAREDQISVDWKTEENGSNRGFWLERLSPAGEAWHRLSWIPAQFSGNYQYLDQEVEPGREYFYRLYQEDYSGDFSYSPIVSARLKGNSNPVFTVFPNPGKDRLVVSMENFSDVTYRLQIHDVYGRVWKDVQLSQQVEMTTESWPAGCYYLHFISGERVLSRKWIKE
ncbi:M36 family metallopeptidase [Lewinella sp. LCG006]|uniref:M36 family metallopeptidase n=1 Tax=Lewinella sp. LCG006 TaxID=3231911 RepID=UPI0034606637